MPPELRIDSLGVRELRFGEVGSYKTGCFYSEAMFGVPYELGPLHRGIGLHDEQLTGFGVVEGGPAATNRILTLLHETSHYVQDLTLGAAIESDLLLDEALVMLILAVGRASARGTVRLPLARFRRGLDAEEQEQLAQARERTALARRFSDDTTLLTVRWRADRSWSLSGTVLMEGLAASHAARALQLRCDDSDERLDYLAEVQEMVRILPEQLGDPYCTALDALTTVLDWRRPADEQPPWPRNQNSKSGLADLATAFLADIACHIPPVEVIARRVELGEQDWSDFMPGHRYAMALAAISKAGGFPDMPPSGSIDEYYVLLFDGVAAAWGWPSWQETSEAWLAKLARMKQLRRSAGDAFRFRLLVERQPDAGLLPAGRPIEAVLAADGSDTALDPVGPEDPAGRGGRRKNDPSSLRATVDGIRVDKHQSGAMGGSPGRGGLGHGDAP